MNPTFRMTKSKKAGGNARISLSLTLAIKPPLPGSVTARLLSPGDLP